MEDIQPYHDRVTEKIRAHEKAKVVRDSALVLADMAQAAVDDTSREWDEALTELGEAIERNYTS